jgi:uncharacterized protein (DUF427 family)
MVRATWNGEIIAESNDTVVVEGNHYFPISSVKPGALAESAHTSVCPWKGTASYFDVMAKGEVNANAAWTYPTPSAAAAQIAGRVAFWKGVTVS